MKWFNFDYKKLSSHKSTHIATDSTGVKIYRDDEWHVITLEEIKFALYRLNNRPRKVIGWTTPIKEFKKTDWSVKNLNFAFT